MRSPGASPITSSSETEKRHILTKEPKHIFHSSCPFGKKCEFIELSNMVHGFLLEGDRSVEAVAVAARVIMKQTTDFLGKFVCSEVCLN